MDDLCPVCYGEKKVFNGLKFKPCKLCSKNNSKHINKELANSFINQEIKVFNEFS